MLNTLCVVLSQEDLRITVSAIHRNKGSRGASMLQGSNLDVILQMKTYEITLLEHSLSQGMTQSQTARLQNSCKSTAQLR